MSTPEPTASFTLYEDQGTTFDYEKGAFSQIPIHWDDKTGTLTLGQRTGTFVGMLDRRTFQIVLVSAAHPVGVSPSPVPSRSIEYAGAELHIQLH